MSERAHTPTCEVNRGGDHGPCSCGRDAEMRRERLAEDAEIAARRQLDAVVFIHQRDVSRMAYGDLVPGSAAADRHALLDVVASLTRQRDALREIVEAQMANCPNCRGTGSEEIAAPEPSRVLIPIPCPRCSRLRAALEVR